MEQKRLWELAGKKIAGEASDFELDELNRLLEKYPDALYALEQIGHYWKASKEQIEFREREAALEKHLQRMQVAQMEYNPDEEPYGTEKRRRRSLVYRLATAAAVVLLVTMAAFWYYDQPVAGGIAMKTLTATPGSRNHFMLPDGSKVWLNAGTTITYPENFIKDTARVVFLSGEAFFEVRHDEHRPFRIHTGQMIIRDLGTSFNVKAWPGDEQAEATLIEGAIEVQLKNTREVAVLDRPREKIIVYNGTPGQTKDSQPQPAGNQDGKPFRIAEVTWHGSDSLLAETAWIKDMLVFDNESFEELAIRMERWYDVHISFENEQLKKYRFTGSFLNETIDQALQELRLIRPFEYTTDNGTIIIR